MSRYPSIGSIVVVVKVPASPKMSHHCLLVSSISITVGIWKKGSMKGASMVPNRIASTMPLRTHLPAVMETLSTAAFWLSFVALLASMIRLNISVCSLRLSAFERNRNPTRLLPINDINSTVKNSISYYLRFSLL